MLVLSRTPNEQISLYDAATDTTIIVEVLEIKGQRVRLGVNAPAHVIVTRPEAHAAPRAVTNAGS